MKSAILIHPVEQPHKARHFVTFTDCCEKMKWSYNYLKQLKKPFTYKGYLIERISLSDNAYKIIFRKVKIIDYIIENKITDFKIIHELINKI